MIWSAWRSQRMLILVALTVVAALAIWLVVTGSIQEDAWTIYASHHCLQPGSSASCMTLADNYYNASHFSRVNVGLAIALPALLGLVLGAPLVARELEQGTNRLAWTQSITRTRWLLVKLAVGAIACAVIVGALVPLLDWWIGAVQRGELIEPGNFDYAGFCDVAYVLFAFMLGAALGAIVRRTGWAFAIGVPLYAAIRLTIRDFVRPGLVVPSATAVDPSGAFPTSGWVVQSGYVPLGRMSPAPGQSWQSGYQLIANCTAKLAPITQKEQSHCVVENKLHYVVQFQPERHFWVLQGAESAIFLGFFVVLCGITVLAVRRWRT